MADSDVSALNSASKRNALLEQIHQETQKLEAKAIGSAMAAARNPDDKELLAAASLDTLEFDLSKRLEKTIVDLIYVYWPKDD